MSLDPHSRRIAEALRKTTDAAAAPFDLTAARANYTVLFNQWAGAPITPVSAQALTLAGPGGPLAATLFAPTAQAAPATLVLFLHGGGWSLGSTEGYERTLRQIAGRSGCAILSLDYRLAPESPFPAALDDAGAAWAAIVDGRCGRFTRRVVMGDSCGGQVAAALCLKLRDEGHPLPAAQILLYPLLDAVIGDDHPSRHRYGDGGHFLTEQDIAWAIGNYLPDPAARPTAYASPLRAPDLSGLPPALLITAGCDPLHDEAAAYARRLAAAGSTVDHADFAGTIHGFVSFAGEIPAGRQALDRVITTLAAPATP